MTETGPLFNAHEFRKSSYSDPQQDCVHIARRVDTVAVRDSKTIFGSPHDRRLMFTTEQFEGLLAITRSATE